MHRRSEFLYEGTLRTFVRNVLYQSARPKAIESDPRYDNPIVILVVSEPELHSGVCGFCFKGTEGLRFCAVCTMSIGM